MKKASIVTIGNEILFGKTVDTNAAHLAVKLQNIGIPVVSTYTVADEIEQIVKKLDLASSDADVIIATGGLGPTDDDLTRQAFAEFLGVKLQLHEELLEKIQQYFPKGLIEKILSQKEKIEGERKQVTVMFCDMEGFTPLVEKLGSEAAYSVMDEVYEILIHKV